MRQRKKLRWLLPVIVVALTTAFVSYQAEAQTKWVKQIVVANGLAQQVTADVLDMQAFNVQAAKYGAVGDNTHDDTTALQSAINDAVAACGIVFLPPPSYAYRITAPLVIQGSGSTQLTLRMIGCASARGTPNNIIYAGAPGTSAIRLLGINYAHFYGVNVSPNSGSSYSNIVCWDEQFSSTFPNASYNTWEHCFVTFNGNQNCIAWRFGQSSTGGANGYDQVLQKCVVTDTSKANGNIGLQVGGGQLYQLECRECSWSSLALAVCNGPIATYSTATINVGDTTINVASTALFPSSGTIQIGSQQISYTGKTATTFTDCSASTTQYIGQQTVNQYVVGQGVYSGTGNLLFLNCGTTGNAQDFYAQQVGPLRVIGGRFETGSRFISTNSVFGNGSGYVVIEIAGAQFSGYTAPADNNGVFWIGGNSTLNLHDCHIYNNATAYGANFLTNNNANNYGTISFVRTNVYAAYPFWTIVNNWPLEVDAGLLNGSNGAPTTRIRQKLVAPITLADAQGGTVTLDLSTGDFFLLPMGGTGTNRTLAFTNAAVGQRFTLIAQQSSGGSDTITWPSVRWQGGSAPTLTTTASKWDRLEFQVPASGTYLGTAWLGY